MKNHQVTTVGGATERDTFVRWVTEEYGQELAEAVARELEQAPALDMDEALDRCLRRACAANLPTNFSHMAFDGS